ncbi:DDB1- and CUL4-associated factor 8-like isoform X3 [Cynara cardunculus var. scolymus]|uniref:DDB1- and CUL4-associated factor 8-like isoform X3 n=1 Tax=Cynara cardunculus var. scolymus TaxID=59895 RepID=UPI000D62BF46|nr:DDB1- and CUL4-associated factor 8-like isoform X3 [Cynara cardunculus var. scolymus]
MMKKRNRASVDAAVVDICRREVGHLSTRKFAHRLAASEDLVLRLDLLRKLEKHRGCVNTVSFNADGDILVSGSDDRRVILWDWETGRVKLSFNSGHNNNIFQAKIMPETDERSIVTCAADGQVRHATILDCGKVETKLLARHQGRAHKLANEPGSPHIFYTCGEDGLVQHFDLRTGEATELFSCQPVRGRSFLRVVNLNAIAIDPRNPNLFVIAGSDEFTRLYDIRRYRWDASAAFDMETDSILGPQLYKGHRNCVTVKGVSFFGPKCEYVVSGSDCGRMFIWRKKDGALVRVMEADKQVVNCIQAHPHTTMLASSGIDRDIKIWTPTALEKAPPPTNIEKLRPKTNSWMYQMVSPRDMALQLLAMRSQQTSPERRRTEDTNAEGNMLEFILTFDANSSDEDDSEDEEGHDRFY